MLRALLIPFLIPFICFSQQKEPDSSSINEIVRKIDKLSKTSSRSFIITKVIKNKKVKETWQYFDNKQLARIIINYTIDSTDYTEEYYFKDGLLIYASENEISRFPSLELDEYIVWGGGFYFSNGKLIDHVTLGHGKSESDDWDPEKEILQRLKKRKKELISLE
jgi:hypothetical protein